MSLFSLKICKHMKIPKNDVRKISTVIIGKTKTSAVHIVSTFKLKVLVDIRPKRKARVMNRNLSFLLSALICIIKCQDDQMPPKVTSTFNNIYYFPRDSNLTDANIECRAQNGQIQYSWRKDGIILNSSFVSVDKSTGTLKFAQMQNSNYGTYQCFANNNFGTSLSKPIVVKESRIGYFPSRNIQDFQCKQFEHCKIPCRDKPPCFPNTECRVEWQIGEGTQNKVEMSNRVGVDGDGDLHFLWTDINDWTGRQYRCGVWHQQLKMLVLGSQTRLNITQASQVPVFDPVSVYESNGKALYKGVGVLRCMFSGYPAPDIEWVSPNKQVIKNSPKYEISDYGRILKIKDAAQSDEGIYLCEGKGKTESNTQLFLNVTSSPILDTYSEHPQMSDAFELEGKEAKFYCEAVSLPQENDPSPPTWKKNGIDLNIDGKKYILSDNNRVLTVTNLQKGRDSGVFQCMSENSEGVLFKEALLKVIECDFQACDIDFTFPMGVPSKTEYESGCAAMNNSIACLNTKCPGDKMVEGLGMGYNEFCRDSSIKTGLATYKECLSNAPVNQDCQKYLSPDMQGGKEENEEEECQRIAMYSTCARKAVSKCGSEEAAAFASETARKVITLKSKREGGIMCSTSGASSAMPALGTLLSAALVTLAAIL